MKKKIISLILSLAMVLSICPVFDLPVFASCSVCTYSSDCDTICNNCFSTRENVWSSHQFEESAVLCKNCGAHRYFKYKANSQGGLTITYCDTSLKGKLIIPEAIEGASVTSIGGSAFHGCRGLTSVVIPDSVTSIGNNAFSECYGLIGIVIPDSVTIIGASAFFYCSNLTSITIPDSVTSIGGSAFWSCKKISSFTIPDSVTVIGTYTFYNCTSLKTLVIPKEVKSIKGNAFSNCTSLTDIWYTGTTSDRNTIERGTANDALISATWHYVDNACDTTCNECGAIRRVPNHVYENDCDTTCNNCEAERTPPHTYDNACDTICNECEAERAVPDHVYDNTCDTTCNECEFLRAITHNFSVQDKDETNHWMKCSVCGVEDANSVSNHAYDNACDSTCDECGYTRTITHNYSVQDKNAETHWMKCSICGEIDETTRKTHTYDNTCDTTCNNCEAERTPPHTYDNAIDPNCNECGAVRILSYDSYGTTGDCFWYLIGTELTIFGNGFMGNYVSTGGPWGKDITKIVIEDGVKNIGEFAFSGCDFLNSIIISNSVITIGGYSFSKCRALITVTIPDSVKNIGSCAFYGCQNLASVSIGDGVVTIGAQAFFNCSSLASVSIPNSVNTIDIYTFYNCYGLTSICLPNSVTTINNNAFDLCTALIDVWYAGTEEDQKKISISGKNDSLKNSIWHYNSCVKNPESEKVHIHDNACDTTCNLCGAERQVPDHTYDDAKDLICNECGYERPPFTPGDVDGVEGVTLDDAIYLLYHVNFSTTYPVNQPVDFNGDGKEDLDDAIYLLYHVNFKDTYPLH